MSVAQWLVNEHATKENGGRIVKAELDFRVPCMTKVEDYGLVGNPQDPAKKGRLSRGNRHSRVACAVALKCL